MITYKLNDQQKKLAEDNLALVKSAIINRFGKEYLSDEDLIQTGYIGLCQAAARFNPDKGIKFSTFAYACICNEVYLYLINSQRSKAARVGCNIVSLNAPTETDGDAVGELMDLLVDGTVNVEATALNRVICEQIRPMSNLYHKHFEDGFTYEYLRSVNGDRNRQAVFKRLKLELSSARKRLRKIGVASRW